MKDIQAWMDGVDERLKAVKSEPAQEDRNHEVESQAWSDLYQHAPNDLTKALNALQEVLNIHRRSDYGGCAHTACDSGSAWPCPTVEMIQDAIGEHDE